MTDFSTVSTSAKSVGAKGREWLCNTENYCPQLTVFIRNRTGLQKSCRPLIRTISVWQDCSLGWGVWKCCELCSWFALQAPREPSSPSTPWIFYRAWAEQSRTADRDPVSVGHSDRLFDLKTFPLMKSRWPIVVSGSSIFPAEVSTSLSSTRLVRCYPSSPVCELPSSIAYICSPAALRGLLFCSQEKGMSPPERLITYPCPISARVHMCWWYAHRPRPVSTVGGGMLSKKTITLMLHKSLKECLHVCFQVLK